MVTTISLAEQVQKQVEDSAEQIKKRWMETEDRQKLIEEFSGDTQELRKVSQAINEYCDTIDAMSEELKSGTTPLKSSPGVTGLKELLRNGFAGLMKPATKKKSCWLKRFLFGQNA